MNIFIKFKDKCAQLKRVDFVVYFGKTFPETVDRNV